MSVDFTQKQIKKLKKDGFLGKKRDSITSILCLKKNKKIWEIISNYAKKRYFLLTSSKLTISCDDFENRVLFDLIKECDSAKEYEQKVNIFLNGLEKIMGNKLWVQFQN